MNTFEIRFFVSIKNDEIWCGGVSQMYPKNNFI
jgi:hypothetical protein